MRDSIPGRTTAQIRRICQEQQSAQQMPFMQVLEPRRVQQAIDEHGRPVRHCPLNPLLTFYAFLAQVLSDASCQEATAKLLAWQTASGRPPCSGDTGPYCKARARLPEQAPATLARQVGQELHQQTQPGRLLQGRPIKIIDGTTVSMPDTPENQKQYPQARTQKKGLGFPVLRLVAILCLHSGVLLHAACGPYKGKQTGETALLRTMLEQFESGDVALGDCYFCSYWQTALLQQRGADSLFRMHQCRKVNWRSGRHLGRHDHVVRWKRPEKPEWMAQELYDSMPPEMEIREVKRKVQIKGFRVKWLVLATTLLDEELYPAAELAEAFRQRWHAELDLRSIKSAMKMDVLRCKSPEMVRKELWMHLLGYNLVRTVMAQAAEQAGVEPRQISFSAGLQLLRNFQPLMSLVPEAVVRQMHEALLRVLGRQRVGNRPDRYEPRAVKRRPKPHKLLQEPREEARKKMEKAA